VATKNIIELNGKSYDALTGTMLGSARRSEHHGQRVAVAAMVPKKPPTSLRHDGHQPAHARPARSTQSMDGFVSHAKVAGQSAHRAQPAHAPHHITAHQPQPTKTLMRRAVQPPHAPHTKAASTAQAIRLHKPLQPIKPLGVATTLSAGSINPVRAHRASHTDRSQLVQHFSSPVGTNGASSAMASDFKPVHHPAHASSHPKISAHPTHHASPMPRPTQVSVPIEDKENDMFTQALLQARSHEEPSPRQPLAATAKRQGRRHRKILGVLAMVLLFVGTCGFVAYQNKANIQLQLASAKAGFSASVPLYKPNGYHLNKLEASNGNVAASFLADSNHQFQITQKKSNWDSQTDRKSVV
jgi:hypothetical protein